MLTTIYDIENQDVFFYNNEIFQNLKYCSCIKNFQGKYYIKCVNYDSLSKEDKLKCFNVMCFSCLGKKYMWKIKQRKAESENDSYITKIYFPSIPLEGERKEYFFADFDSTKDEFIRVLG